MFLDSGRSVDFTAGLTIAGIGLTVDTLYSDDSKQSLYAGTSHVRLHHYWCKNSDCWTSVHPAAIRSY